MKAYIGAKIIQAEPGNNPKVKPGDPAQPGYIVVYPDGYVSWSPKSTFEAAYREISRAEGELVTFVDADNPECDHVWGPYNEEISGRKCKNCPATSPF